jgi:putative endonuclease
MKKQWFMYVVVCCDKSLYCGITTDVSRRIKEHNSSVKGSKYTRARRPVKLLYVELHNDRSSASKAEYAFKKLSRKSKLGKINGN